MDAREGEDTPSTNRRAPVVDLSAGKRFHLAAEDLMDGWKAQRRHSIVFKVYRGVIFVGLGFFALVSAVLLLTGQTLADTSSNLIMLATFGVVFASIPLKDRLRARRLLRQQKSLQRELSVNWDSETITWASANGISTQPWADYWKCVEGKQTFVFMHSASMCNMLPKRVLSADEIADIRTHLSVRGKARKARA